MAIGAMSCVAHVVAEEVFRPTAIGTLYSSGTSADKLVARPQAVASLISIASVTSEYYCRPKAIGSLNVSALVSPKEVQRIIVSALLGTSATIHNVQVFRPMAIAEIETSATILYELIVGPVAPSIGGGNVSQVEIVESSGKPIITVTLGAAPGLIVTPEVSGIVATLPQSAPLNSILD
jgi:hypothetical protein